MARKPIELTEDPLGMAAEPPTPLFQGVRLGIITNTAYLTAARVAQLLAAFTVSVYVSRHLGPAGWGALAYSVSFVGLFAGIASLGLDSIVVRDLAAEESAGRKSAILTAAFTLKLAASVITLAAIVAIALLSSGPDDHTSLTLIVALGLVFTPLSVIDLHYQSHVLSKYVVRVQIVVIILTSILRIALVLLDAPLTAFAWVILADGALLMLGLALSYPPGLWLNWDWREQKVLALRLLRNAWPLAITTILTSVYVNLDRVMIKDLLDFESAGRYSVVLNIGTALYFIPLALGQSVFPTLVRARSDAAAYHLRLQQCFNVALWCGVAMAIPVSVFASELIYLVYGPSFSGAGQALAIYIWCSVGTLLGLVASYWLVAENLQHLYPVRILASLLTCLGLNALLIPRWGISGAAASMLVAQFVSSTVAFAFNKKTHLIPAMQLNALLLPLRIWSRRAGRRNSLP